MEGLNKLCLCPRRPTWDHEYQSMHGVSSISASRSRQGPSSRTPNQWGNHSHINNGTHRLPHQPKTHVFTKNCHPKSYFFHCPEFWKFFSQRTLIDWNLRKRYPNVPYFYGFCDWKTPYFLPCIHMVCLRGMLQTGSAAGKFCILETEPCNLVNTFRCKFNKGDENKISVLQAQPTQLCIMDEFHWRAGMIYRLLSP